MKTATRIRQLSTGVMAVLALSVSSIAACACTHHEVESRSQPSCHSTADHSSRTKTGPTGHHVSESCLCILSATDLLVKSEGFKLKKHHAVSSAETGVESAGFYSAALSDPDTAGTHFYSTLFDTSTAARGPPLT